jgi:hypothetical protein
MGRLWLHLAVPFGFALCLIAPSQAQESVKSTPKDTNIYSRPAIAADTAAPPLAAPGPGTPSAPPTSTNVMRVFDVIVNNTNVTLKNTDTIGGTETSIAVNPNNRNQITISAFSSAWGSGNAVLWNSTDGGQTWTRQFTIPVPPGVPANATSFCPCDQTFDYGRNNVLFGTFLTATFPPAAANDNVYSGSTNNPASAASWAWWVVGGVAQMTNLAATSITNADQPWLLRNRGTSNAAFENVYVAYDDFGVSPVTTRVSASINQIPPQFTSDQPTGNTGGGGVNPGHRLAADPRNGWMYSLFQNCTAGCGSDPKTISYMLNRSIDQGSTWSLNGSSTGIQVASAQSHQPTPKFGTVNALLGGVDHAAVDPSTGDLYYVYGILDGSSNNALAIRRVFDNGAGGVTVGPQHLVTNGTAAIPSVTVTRHGTVGVFFYVYNGMVSGFPQFTGWLAVSTDQGVSFSYLPLKTFLSPATDNGMAGQRVLGDYVQMKAIDNCFYGSFVANRAAFFGATAIDDPIFFKACYGQSASTHDASGDGFSDIVWYNNTSGQVVVWFVNGTSVIGGGSPGSAPSPWAIVGQRDFNGDGFSDILWRNATTGQTVVWLLNQNATVIGGGLLGTAASPWVVVGTGDFDGDGFGDVLWYNGTTGQVVVWLTDGTSVIGGGSLGFVGSPWTVAGTGDFTGEGNTDILWYNTSTGQAVIWVVAGTIVAFGGSPGTAASPWAVAGTGDFNNDGKWDILWRNSTTGQVVIWFLNGVTVTGGGSPGSVGSPWTVAQTGDFNSDGFSDILWYNSTTGQLVEWFLSGASVIGGGSPGAAGSPWQVQGLNSD